MKVIIVGAGFTCAKVLREGGAEVTEDSSINGSMLSGEKAAHEVLR